VGEDIDRIWFKKRKRKPSWVSFSCFGGKSERKETTKFFKRKNTNRVAVMIKDQAHSLALARNCPSASLNG
jgi:hypothetical protein